MTHFPLDLKEETITPIMVYEPHTYEEQSLTHVIDGVLGELDQEGTMLVKVSEKVV